MAARTVLVVNAGSSSLKYQVLDTTTGATAATGIVEQIGGAGHLRHTSQGRTHEVDVSCPDHRAALQAARSALREHGPDLVASPPFAVGHRVVHGGPRFTEPVVIDDGVIAAIRELVPLAPLHNPANLEGILSARESFPDVPQVAVFDTAFHQSLPAHAHTYAVPLTWRERHQVRRYGFHGTSHRFVSRRTAELLGRDPGDCNVIVLHLGNGASACAVQGGRSIDTSMGLSPLEGLVMGTRSGDVDPALGAYLARVADLDATAYDEALNKASGLLGLAGVSDLRELEGRRADGDADAALAFDVMVYRLRKYVGAYAVALGRVDAIAFTGGIGENSTEVRHAVLSGLAALGVEVDPLANVAGDPERLVTAPDSRIPAYVVPTNEELEIARACLAVLGEDGPV
ncbi:acetate/propionate family kinase [Phycicoccus sp. Soil803]|uniref:acetate/propionate family kinase n=1 Tax=Phycicoccus sp. Soil803 TaxID=1736415 RepID=UPI00070F1659|nr:acetate kinase [Phycicoccus sp. Soil803]KRF24974.1 acetate kinase [Phycicoccus sp. Soil803]